MKTTHFPIVLAGQLYLDEEQNKYLIVTRNIGNMVSFAGSGFRGQQDVQDFVDRVLPVDPVDVSLGEQEYLLKFCPPGTTTKIGYIKEE